MKKFLGCSAGLLLAAVAMAAPAEARAVFRGGAVISALSAGCASGGWSVGDMFTARYHLAGLDGNPAWSSISLFQDFGSAMHLTPGNGDFKAAALGTVTVTSIGNSAYQYEAAAKVVRTPATVTASTPTLKLVATIKNFDEIGATCLATLTLQLFRRDPR